MTVAAVMSVSVYKLVGGANGNDCIGLSDDTESLTSVSLQSTLTAAIYISRSEEQCSTAVVALVQQLRRLRQYGTAKYLLLNFHEPPDHRTRTSPLRSAQQLNRRTAHRLQFNATLHIYRIANANIPTIYHAAVY